MGFVHVKQPTKALLGIGFVPLLGLKKKETPTYNSTRQYLGKM